MITPDRYPIRSIITIHPTFESRMTEPRFFTGRSRHRCASLLASWSDIDGWARGPGEADATPNHITP